MKKFFFDLETTGVNPAKNGIHQISGIIEIDDVVVEEFDIKVRPNPKAIIEDAALEVGGVSKEQILSYQDMHNGYEELTGILSKYVDKYDKKDKFFMIGYNNASFDNNFLRGFFLQNGDKYFGSWFWANTVDVMVMATDYLLGERQNMVNFKLSTVADYLGVKVESDKLHDAMYDIYLTREVYRKVTNKN